jgi:hypothetical protein
MASNIDNLRAKPAIYINPVRPFNGIDYKKELGMEIEEFNKQIFSKQLSPIQYIYIDFLMLKDIYLGALLLLCTPNEYQYIITHLENYNNKVLNDSVLNYFPKVKTVTDADIHTYISDPKNSLQLAIASPVTRLYNEFVFFMRIVLQHNSVLVGTSECADITLCINTYPLPYSSDVKNMCAMFIKSIHDKFKLQYVSSPLAHIDEESLLINGKPRYDIMFIYDLSSFISEESKSYRSFVKHLRYFHTYIFTPPRIELSLYDEIKKSGKNFDDIFKNTEAVMSLSCNFKYIDIPIVP